MPPPLGHENWNKEGIGRPNLWTQEMIEQLTIELLEFIKDPNNLFMNKFLLSKGITRKRYNEFKEMNDNFRNAYELARELQEERLIEGSVFKQLDTTMSKFALVNNHGYKDKTESTINGDIMDPFANVLAKVMDSSRGLDISGKK